MKKSIGITLGVWEFDDISHQFITDGLGIEPTLVHVKGERIIPRFERLAEWNSWLYRTPGYEVEDFDKQMSDILELVVKNSDFIMQHLNRYNLELSCCLTVNASSPESNPWVHISKEQSRILADHNLNFDVDMYVLP
jgi:hypothetical protein